MRIESKFKDYYDYVAYLYGGGDPKVYYHRRDLYDSELRHEVNGYAVPNESLYTKNGELHELFGAGTVELNSIDSYWNSKWLIVMGKLYLLVAKYTNKPPVWKVLSKSHELYKYLPKRRLYSDIETINLYIDRSEKIYLDLCKKLKTPVFVQAQAYNSSWRSRPKGANKAEIVLEPKVPNLGELGFTALYSPEQLYQDLSYFMANTINDSPDMTPPVAISDKDKLLQHGFDPKRSFRH